MVNKVIENNFKALYCQIIILIISISLTSIVFELLNKKYYQVGQIFLVIFFVFMYLYAGFRFSPTQNALTDLLSFVLVSLIGILLWLYAFIVSHNTSCNISMFKNDVAWWFYQLYYFVFILFEQIIDSFIKTDFCEIQAYVEFLWNLGPILLFFLGIRIRRIYDRHQTGAV